jgi:hypothetical protein
MHAITILLTVIRFTNVLKHVFQKKSPTEAVAEQEVGGFVVE